MRSQKCIQCGHLFFAFCDELICTSCREGRITKIKATENVEIKKSSKYGVCPVCGKEFIRDGISKTKVYCSRKCKENAHKRRNTAVVNGKIPAAAPVIITNKINKQKKEKPVLDMIVKCLFCGKEFHPKSKLAKYCSRKCQEANYYYRMDKVCKKCGKIFHSTGKRTMYCKDCQMQLFGVVYKSQFDNLLATREFQFIESKREQNALNHQINGKAKIFRYK